MADRKNYVVDQIHREDLARRNYENARGTPKEKEKLATLGDEYDRTVRAINRPDAGGGRGFAGTGKGAGELGKKWKDTFKE